MIYFLWGLCAMLIIIICILGMKIASLHKATAEIGTAFANRLREDTNVGIDVTTQDRYMRKLAQDIDTQLKVLRKEHIRYTQGDRELKDAVTNIAHDLRTPLTAICGYMELIEQETMSDAASGYIEIIGNRVEALKVLTEELFRYSVILAVPPAKTPDTVILNHAIEECVASYYGLLSEKGITPEILLPELPIVRQLNNAALSRILGNIVNNAVKYSDGDLRITLTKAGIITFQNHASKLDAVSVEKLFDRFYTVDNGQKGTGLGLSIAKVLTEQLGRSIHAAKDGIVFTVQLHVPEDADHLGK